MNSKIPKEVYNVLGPLYRAYLEYDRELGSERTKLKECRYALQDFLKRKRHDTEYKVAGGYGTGEIYISCKVTSDHFVIDKKEYSLREFEELIRQTKKNIRIAQHNRDKALQLYFETEEPYRKQYNVGNIIYCSVSDYMDTKTKVDRLKKAVESQESELNKNKAELSRLEERLEAFVS